MIHEVGSWQHFVKRQDNLGLPIMEVKQKYLKEMNNGPIDLTGGGSIRTTPAPTVYTVNFSQCCGYGVETVYTTSSSIIIGTIFYTTPGLTTRFTSPLGVYRTGTCLPIEDGSFSNDGYSINNLGVVTAINQFVNCQ